MKAYLQELDTVNFSVDNTPAGLMSGKLMETKIKTAVYSVFYEISLAPNQALDLVFLRNIEPTDSLTDLPFAFHAETQTRSSTPFMSSLVQLLRRCEEDAFVFSSTSDSINKAKEWGRFIARSARKISDGDLLREGSQDCFYAEIVEWARRLDAERTKLTIRPYTSVYTFESIFKDYIETQEWFPSFDFLGIPVPKSRSRVYSRIEESQLRTDEKKAKKEVPDLISNTAYALGCASKLVIQDTSSVEFATKGRFPDLAAALYIDLAGLLTAYPDLDAAIRQSSWKEISYARSKSEAASKAAWTLLASGRKKQAAKKFGEALSLFTKHLTEESSTSSDAIVEFTYRPDPNSPGGEFGFKPNFLNQTFLGRLFQKSFSGMHKFIRIL
jgi:hypothetical protein